MVQYLLLLVMAIGNIALGYGLAVAFSGARAPSFDLWWLLPDRFWLPRVPQRAAARLPERIDDRPASTPTDEPAVPAVAIVDATEPQQRADEEIPQEWLDLLDETIECNSFVEASVQVLKLEVGRYREELLRIDEDVRACAKSGVGGGVNNCLHELRDCNEAWLARQAEATKHLSSRQGGLGDFSDMGSALEDILLEQTAQIETTCSNIEHLDFVSDLADGCRRLSGEISKLVDMAHSLRDRMHESLLSIMRHEKRIDSIDKRLQLDGLTGLYNLTGIEKVFDEWWRDDPNRIRQVSVAEIDIDQVGRFNRTHGAHAGDRLIQAVGGLVDQLVRKDRGFDVASRVSGQRFLAFFGDTGPRAATSAVERIRQTIAATTFECDSDELEITVSCGVAEVGTKEGTASLMKRLGKCIRSAKGAGRNTTFLDEGAGPAAVEPPVYEVKGRVVSLDP